MFGLRPCRPDEAGGHEPGDQHERNLPHRIQEIGKEQIHETTHDASPFVFLNCSLNLASRFASIWRLFKRLITNSSLDPPNRRSITSRRVCPNAFSSVSLAEYT